MSGVMRTIPRVLPRTAAMQVPRAFGTTAVNRTGLKDSIKNVDRKVSDKLVDGIEIGSAVASKVKQAGEDITHGKATGHASQLRQEAEQARRDAGEMASDMSERASEVGSEVSSKASEAGSEMSGKASEMSGKAKGKAEEVGGKVKGKAEEAKRKVGGTTGNPT